MKKNSPSMGQVNWKRIVLGGIVGMGMTLALVGLAAVLMDREMLALKWINYAAAVILVISGFVGAAAVFAGGNLLETALAAGLYWVALFAVNALLFECVLSGLLPTLLAVIGGWGSGALLLGLRVQRPRSHRRRYKNR